MALCNPNRRQLLGGLAAASLARPALAQQRTPLTVAAYGGVFEKTLREQVIPEIRDDARRAPRVEAVSQACAE